MDEDLPAPANEQKETLIKVTSVAFTFVVTGLLTCLLLAWLVSQIPALERLNQGLIYQL